MNREKNVFYWGTTDFCHIKTQMPLKAIFPLASTEIILQTTDINKKEHNIQIELPLLEL